MKIGEGYISGFLSILFACLSFGAALCLLFPEYLTTEEFRNAYPAWLFRAMLFGCLLVAFCFAFSSFLLSRKSKLGLIGISISTIAVLFGGNQVGFGNIDQNVYSLSVDWLLIDILILSVIFIPIELFLPQREDQTKFHAEWKTDAIYFVISHLLVQYVAILVKLPAETLFRDIGLQPIQSFVLDLPFIVQVLLAMFVADLFQYATHRFFHLNKYLWRFHAVHHSIEANDWVSGSRLHLVDILITRSMSYIPLYVLGFSIEAFYTYVVIVAVQTVAEHSNTRLPFGPLKYVFVTPQYHHWHHSNKPEHYDQNFAIHFPVIDWIFGTYYLPGNKWPEATGLSDYKMPKGYIRQFLHPFGK